VPYIQHKASQRVERFGLRVVCDMLVSVKFWIFKLGVQSHFSLIDINHSHLPNND
jgi:hypothetical protein